MALKCEQTFVVYLSASIRRFPSISWRFRSVRTTACAARLADYSNLVVVCWMGKSKLLQQKKSITLAAFVKLKIETEWQNRTKDFFIRLSQVRNLNHSHTHTRSEKGD